MQQRNLLLFFLLSAVIVLGALQLRQRLWPPEKPAKPDPAVLVPKPKGKKPSGALAQLPPQPAVTPDRDLVELGSTGADSRYNLGVRLDPLGAGVRSVTLNKFKEADRNGRPVDEPLELVPAGANRHTPSNLVYHFDPTDSSFDHPLDTLGRVRWEVVRGKDGKAVRVEEAEGNERQSVSFRAEALGVKLKKTYTLTQGDYHVGLVIDLERPKAAADARASEKQAVLFRYQLTGAKGLPVEGKWYTSVFRNAFIGLEDDRGYIDRNMQDLRQISLWGGGNLVRNKDRLLRYAAVGVQYFAAAVVVDDKQTDQRFLRQGRPTLETAVARGKIQEGGLAAPEQVVLLNEDGKTEERIFLPPDLRDELAGAKEGTPIAVVYRLLTFSDRLEQNGERGGTYKLAERVAVGEQAAAVHALWEDDVTVRVTTEQVEMKPGEKVTHRYLLYHGPVKPSLLGDLRGDKAVAGEVLRRYTDTLQLNTMTDHPSPGWVGEVSSRIGWSFVVIKCTNLMHWVLGHLYGVVPSLGLCIILLTVMVRGVMFPLSRKQALMSLRMQELAPELKKLQAKHKDDKQALAAAQFEMYRKHGVSPFGSCWVVFLQMPIFMGLYYALQESIQFRLAGFWPTWIDNLAAPDMLVRWGDGIPILSQPQSYGGFIYLGPYLNLLPILAVSLMIVQQKMLMPPPADEQQEMQQKMMKYMMVFMGLMFYKVAAGLCLYFIASSLWGFAERKLLPKNKLKVGGLELAGATAAGGSGITTAPRGGGPAPTSQGVTAGKKSLRNKRGRGAPVKAEEPRTRLGRLSQRLSAWWADVLEQAKKK
jgi:YidC/Oxa1 family membrane protein insertase